MANDKTEYRDESHITEASDVDQSKVPSAIKKLSTWIRQKMYGEDVRESIARGIEKSGEVAQKAVDISVDTSNRQDNVDQSQKDFEDRYNNQIAGNTDLNEVIDARKPAGGEAYQTLGKRLDTLQVANDIDIDDELISGGYVKPFFETEIARVKAELKPDLFTIGFMTDNHWETADRDKPYGSYSLNHIKNLLAFSDSADLLMLNGDNVNLDNVDLNVGKHETETLVSVFLDEPIDGDVDRFIQLGNHDDGSTRRRFKAKNFLAQDEYLHDDYFKEVYRTNESQGEVRNNDSLYFYKDYPDAKIRLISLNTSDIIEGELDASGSQKWDRWGTLAVRQEQLNWFANVALMNVPTDYQIIVTSHCPLDATYLYANDISRYWNMDIVAGVLAAANNGTSYTGTSTGGQYPVAVSVDYTDQGSRPVIGNFGGHFHTEWIHDYLGLKIVEVNRSLVDDAKKSSIGTAQEDMFDVIQVDTANRHVYIYGFGGSTDRGYDY